MTKLNVLENKSEIIAYNCPYLPIYANEGRLSEFENYTAEKHYHEDLEFVLPFSGDIEYCVEDEYFRVKEGDVIFVNANRYHYGFSADKTDCAFLCVTFKPERLGLPAQIVRDQIEPLTNFTNVNAVVLSSESNDIADNLIINQLKQAFGSAYNREYNKIENNELSVLANVLDITANLYKKLVVLARKHEAPKDNYILKEMLKFIQKNYNRDLKLNEIAASAAVCRNSCCKIFRDVLNLTPGEYLTKYRLTKATELLKDTKLSVTEVALSTGFCSPSYFCKTFRRALNVSPLEYRKSGRTQ